MEVATFQMADGSMEKSEEEAEFTILLVLALTFTTAASTLLTVLALTRATTEEDAEEAEETVDIYRAHGFQGPVYLMPVGGVETIYSLNNKRVAEMAMKLGYRYSDRLQVPLFKNAWGT